MDARRNPRYKTYKTHFWPVFFLDKPTHPRYKTYKTYATHAIGPKIPMQQLACMRGASIGASNSFLLLVFGLVLVP